MEPVEEEDEDKDRGKNVPAGSFVYIVSMVVRQTAEQNVVYFRGKMKKERATGQGNR